MAEHTSSEKIPVVLVCGQKKHECLVFSEKPHGLPIVDDLQRCAESITGIPVDRQRLIFKGKTLRQPNEMLCEVGIEPHSRVMIVGQRFDPGEGETCSKIQRILESCHESEKKLQSLRAEVAGVQGNHLPQHLHSQAVTKQTRTGAGIQEQLVKLLEQLDALVLEQDQAEARARRKAAVQHIQATLDSADSLQQQLAELKQKVS